MTHRPGVYQHYRGDHYRLLFAARMEAMDPDNYVPLLAARLSEDRDARVSLCLDAVTGQLWVVPEAPASLIGPYALGTYVVVYTSLANRTTWVRPLLMWRQSVRWPNGFNAPRFRWVGESLP